MDLLSKVLREVLFLDLMDGIFVEPIGNSWKCNMRRRLYDGSRSHSAIVACPFNVLSGHLDEIGWDNKREIRR
jgi:hypothetical protein